MGLNDSSPLIFSNINYKIAILILLLKGFKEGSNDIHYIQAT